MALTFTPGQLRRRSELYHQLGQLTAAGITLPAALAAQRQHPVSSAFLAPLARLQCQLEDGQTFGEALQTVPRWMPPFDAALLQAGEQSGHLPASFQMLGRYYQNQASLARQLLTYLAYPAFLLHLGVLIFPVQQLQQLILQGQVLGYAIQKLMILLPLYAMIFFGIVALQSNRGEAWRATLEKLFRLVPGLGSARRHLALARLSAALEALIRAGVSVIEAWELAAVASGSPALRRVVHRAKPQLYDGLTPAEMVNRSAMFPPAFATQYQTGEISGQLEESLQRLRDYHEQEGFRQLKTFLVILAGLIIGMVMLLAAWQIISFWLQYFKQIQEVIPD